MLHEGYILHRRPYRESSAILEVFTREHGRVGLVARGVRRGQKRGSVPPALFAPYLFNWAGKGDLLTMRSVEASAPGTALSGDSLYAGLYANELLMRLCTRHDPHPELYEAYTVLLDALGEASEIDVALRYFERDLLGETGYGLNLQFDAQSGAPIEPALRYAYRARQGPVADNGPQGLQGDTLLALQAGSLQGERQRREARQLMRHIIHDLMGNKPLQSLQTMRRMREMSRPATAKQERQDNSDRDKTL